MPFGKKPELKSDMIVDFDQSTTRRSNRPLRAATEEAAAGLTLGYRELKLLQRRRCQKHFEFGHLLPGRFLHPFFGSGSKGFLQSLLTERFFLQSNARFGKCRQNPIPFFGKLTSSRKASGSYIRCQPLVANRDHFLPHASRLHEVGNRFRKTDGMGCAFIEQVGVVDPVVMVVAQIKAALVSAHSFIEVATLVG